MEQQIKPARTSAPGVVLKTVGGIEIRVREDGRFVADVGGRRFESALLGRLERKLSTLPPAQRVLFVTRNVTRPRVLECYGVDGYGRLRTSEGPLRDWHGQVFAVDAAAVRRFEDLNRRQADLLHEWVAERKALGPADVKARPQRRRGRPPKGGAA